MRQFLLVAILSLLTLPVFAAKKSVLDIQHWTTQRGTRVYFVRVPELPMLDISVAFAAGSGRDGQNYGLAQLTNAMLNEGTQQANANTLAQQLDQVGAIYSNDVDRDQATVNLRTLTEPQALQQALDTYTDILTRANFPVDAFERLQQQTLTAIAYEQQDAPTQASQLFYRTLYGQHPYAHPVSGTESSVKQLMPSDTQKFYRRFYVARNGIIAMVGDVTRAQAKKIAEQISAPLPEGVTAPALPLAPTLTKSIEKKLNFPTSQTVIRLGQVGINRTDPDYFPLLVGNHILGGSGMVSRRKSVV